MRSTDWPIGRRRAVPRAAFHTYSTFARGVELLRSGANLLDLTPLGRQDA
jgi:predicted dithiol-disulfide oxidoreductase (DUF899 family)